MCSMQTNTYDLQFDMEQLKLSVTKIESDFDAQSKHLNGKITELSSALDAAHDDNDHLRHRVETGILETMANRKRYLDSVRQCCAELLSLNAGVANLKPVIRSVLKHVGGFEVQALPAPTTLMWILTEMKVLACQQLSEELTKSKDVTLRSYGTSKWG